MTRQSHSAKLQGRWHEDTSTAIRQMPCHLLMITLKAMIIVLFLCHGNPIKMRIAFFFLCRPTQWEHHQHTWRIRYTSLIISAVWSPFYCARIQRWFHFLGIVLYIRFSVHQLSVAQQKSTRVSHTDIDESPLIHTISMFNQQNMAQMIIIHAYSF